MTTQHTHFKNISGETQSFQINPVKSIISRDSISLKGREIFNLGFFLHRPHLSP
jgi:hypothetical protein